MESKEGGSSHQKSVQYIDVKKANQTTLQNKTQTEVTENLS